MPTSPAPTTTEIRQAVSIIHEAVRDPDRHHDPVEVATAHTTLVRACRSAEPPVDQWLADYLDPDTWHHGPCHLVDQIDTLAVNFKLPPPIRTGPPDGNQGTLF